MKKERSRSLEGRPSPSYPHIPEEIASREGTPAGRLTTVEDKEKLFDKRIQDKKSFVKSLLPPFMAGAAGGGLAASQAEAAARERKEARESMAGFGGLTGGVFRQAFPWQGREAFMPTRGLIPLFATGGIAALTLPDEAEASPRPKYMEELVRKLETGDFTPMDFGNLSGAQLRKLQSVDPSFTEGPINSRGET